MQRLETPPDTRPLSGRSTRELLRRLGQVTKELLQNEAKLARLELRADLRRELAAVTTMGIAAVCVIAAFVLFLVALVFVLAPRFTPWGAALLVGGAMLVVGGVLFGIGWSQRVKKPLERTQESLK